MQSFPHRSTLKTIMSASFNLSLIGYSALKGRTVNPVTASNSCLALPYHPFLRCRVVVGEIAKPSRLGVTG